MISYDLNKPGQDYAGLYKAIKQFNWCHPVESTWLIVTTKTCVEIRDLLKPHLDANDELLVTKLEGDWASYGLSPTVTEWLNKNVVWLPR